MATIRKRQDGWQVQIRRKGFAPISKTFHKKNDAERWARQTEAEIDNGRAIQPLDSCKLTLADLLLRYRDEVTIHKKGKVEESSRIRTLLTYPIAVYQLTSLTASHIASYRDERLEQVCGTTVNKELNLLAHAIDTAIREWNIHMNNPVRTIRRPKSNRPRDRRLIPGEEERLLAATESPMLALIIRFCLETAMRRGEVVAMCWEHVDWERRTLLIPETKTDTPRQTPLSSRAIAVLEGLQRRGDGLVFGVRSDSVTQAFERACRRAGIEGLHFHDLRHEATSRLFEKGLNPMQVATITGHMTLEMLKRYTHLRAADLVGLLG